MARDPRAVIAASTAVLLAPGIVVAGSIAGHATVESDETTRFTLTIDADGASGSIRYDRPAGTSEPALVVTASPACTWVSDDGTRALAAGPADVRHNPKSAPVDDWFFAAVQKVPADVQRVRARFISAAEGRMKCQEGESMFPGVVRAGGFDIGSGTGATTAAPDAGTPSNSRCEAYYSFDNTLADGGGNGFDGEIIGPDGTGPQFTQGRTGSALLLSGYGAVRTPLDLHFDACAEITFTAWINVLPDSMQTMHVLSTGGGSGPGLNAYDTSLTLTGTESGISRPDIVEKGTWTFVAGVYDYGKGEYTLHWGSEGDLATGTLSQYRIEPRDAFWIGTLHDDWGVFADGIAIDELRIIGRAMSPAEVAGVRDEGYEPDIGTNREAGDDPCGGPACESNADCVAGTYCAYDNTCHPDRHLPKRTIELAPAPAPGIDIVDQQEESTGAVDPEGTQRTIGPDTRPEPVPVIEVPDQFAPAEEIICDAPVVSALGIESNMTYPASFVTALEKAIECGLELHTVELNDNDEWIVSAGDQVAYSENLPLELRRTLDRFERDHGRIDAAEVMSSGAWLVTANSEYVQESVPGRMLLRTESVTDAGRRVTSVATDPTNASRWLMVDNEGNVYGEQIPVALADAMAHFEDSQVVPRRVQFMPDGGWILLGNDHWYVSGGLRDNQLREFNLLRRNDVALEHVLGYQSPGAYLAITNSAPPARPSDRIWQFENGFGSGRNLNIWSQMADFEVTGLSISAVVGNQVAWTRGYGLRNARELESYVQPDTTFDVASVSKAVASFALMQLVDDGLIDIETDGELEEIESIIPSDKISDFRNDVEPEKGNVIQVMQHCAGFCYAGLSDCHDQENRGGAREYDVNRTPPTTTEVILGTSPAISSSRPLRSGPVGDKHTYTSANYVLLQALMDIHGGGFVAHTDQLFADLGMTSSTFASPYPGRNGGNFARGHDDGVLKPMVAYGELAGASLVSTSADIARFLIAINQGGGGVLPSERVDQLLGRDPDMMQYCDEPGDMALGIFHRSTHGGWSNREAFWHGGSHNGYRAMMIGFPGAQAGLVVIASVSREDWILRADGEPPKFYSWLAASFRDAYGL